MLPAWLSWLSSKLPSDYKNPGIFYLFPSNSLGLSWNFMEQPLALAAAEPHAGWETVAYLSPSQTSLFSGNLASMQIYANTF